MKTTLTFVLITVLALSAFGQNGRFDLRFVNPIVNFQLDQFFIDLEIKASSNNEQFYMANQSYCFTFSDATFQQNLGILASYEVGGLVLQDNFATISLFSNPMLSVVGNTACLQIQLLDGDGFYVASNEWSRVATVALIISDYSELGSLTFSNGNDTPPTFIEELFQGGGIQVQEGNYTNLLNTSLTELPIELTAFDAKVLAPRAVELTWTTQTETNNDFFTVERSSDGDNFTALTTINGAGTSLDPLEYRFLDTKPLSGKSYYRLKQTDFDGTYTYSPVISASVQEQIVAPVVVYPNPVQEKISVQFAGFAEEQVSIQVFDINGKVVLEDHVYMDANGQLESTFYVDHLNPGNYQVRISTEYGSGYIAVGRFVKI